MASRLLVVACVAHALQPHAGDRRAALEPRASCDRRAFGAQVAALLTTPAAAAEVVTADKVAAKLAFDSPWPLQKGNYYDVEAKSKEGGDGCFVVVKTPPRGAAPSALPKAWFADNIFNIEGRYGAYGAPQDIKLVG